MTLEETRKRILEDDEFVASETKKLQELFKLKKVIRYHFDRTEKHETESVAEHVYAMHVLVHYFLPLEDPNNSLNIHRIYGMIQYHDIDEIITGDKIGYLKTQADRETEALAAQQIITRIPTSMQRYATELLNEYEEQKTIEAQFTKAIDRIEPTFHLYRKEGKDICHFHNANIEDHFKIKDPYTQRFPCIHRFNKVIGNAMIDEGFFTA